jgi:hypothetical protein
MISVTRACRSTGVGRAMVFPPSYCRSPPNLQIPAGRGNSAASTDTKELRAVHTRPIEQLRPTFAVADSRTVLGRRRVSLLITAAELQKLFSPTRWFAGDRSDWRTQIKWAAVLVQ